MPKKKQPAVEALAPVTQITGYQRPHRYREFAYTEHPDLVEGQEPLRITVRSNLSFEELDAIPYSGVTYDEVRTAIAPYVVGWNLIRPCLETGQMERVPPPAEVGPEIMQLLDHIETNWVLDKVKLGYLQVAKDAEDAAKKMRQFLADAKERASRGSEPTPEPSRGDAEGSGSPKKSGTGSTTRQPD